MFGSTDSLKKKVCVTVFLDELFEEVLEEEFADTEKIDRVSQSEVKTTKKLYKKTPIIGLSKNEIIASEAENELFQAQQTPRKPRKHSKFSKNQTSSFQTELHKYENGSCSKTKKRSREPMESSISESEFDPSEVLKLKKSSAKDSLTSSSEHSKTNVTIKSILTTPSNSSSKSTPGSKIDKNKSTTLKGDSKYRIPVCNKSIQFDEEVLHSANQESEVSDERVLLDQDINKNFLGWEKSVTLLSLSKSRESEKEICKENGIQTADLSTDLKECKKSDENANTKDIIESLNSKISAELKKPDVKECPDSNIEALHYNRQVISSSPEVEKVWSSSKENLWNNEVESDISEMDLSNHTEETGLESIHNDTLLLYTFFVKSRYQRRGLNDNLSDCIEEEEEEEDDDDDDYEYGYDDDKNINSMNFVLNSEFYNGDSSFENVNYKKAHISKPENLSSGENKNFAEGDAFEKSLFRELKLISDLQKKDEVYSDDTLKKGPQTKVIEEKIIVNKTNIKLRRSNCEEVTENKLNSINTKDSISCLKSLDPIYVKKKKNDENATDVESEMPFADSEAVFENEDMYSDNWCTASNISLLSKHGSPESEIRVFKLESKPSLSDLTKVKLWKGNSFNDLKKVNANVLLICKKITNEFYPESRKSSLSILNNRTKKMRDGYLNDCSSNNSMYVLNLPTPFSHANRIA